MNADTYDDWARWAAIISHDREVGAGSCSGVTTSPLAEVERSLDWLRCAHLPEGFNPEFTIPETKKERDA